MVSNLHQKILSLKKKRQAIILAHNYQTKEVQDVADFVGDSLELSLKATQTKAKIIVFCGVRFMAETAAILNPRKTVLIPDKKSCCPMAKMINIRQLKQLKKKHPQAKIVCYANSNADIKAESDICCTSANGEKVINSLDAQEIIFIPDQHLGDYLKLKTKKNLILFPGFCPVHVKVKLQDIIQVKENYPKAIVLTHPECPKSVRKVSDQILSTGGMCRFVAQSQAKEFIINTETGLIHHLKKENPAKTFYPASSSMICPDMKKINLEKILAALEEMKFPVKVPSEIARKARKAIEKMIAL